MNIETTPPNKFCLPFYPLFGSNLMLDEWKIEREKRKRLIPKKEHTEKRAVGKKIKKIGILVYKQQTAN
jgi:hypothetical protein